MKTVTIDRAKWAREIKGKPNHMGNIALLNEQGNMCCLGFVCKAYGVSNKAMLGVENPNDVDHPRVPSILIRYDEYSSGGPLLSALADNTISLNDCGRIPAKELERELKKLFKEAGIELVFSGRTPTKAVPMKKAIDYWYL